MSSTELDNRPLSAEAQALKADLQRNLRQTLGVSEREAEPRDWMHAAAFAVRERLADRRHASALAIEQAGAKQVAYLSMEFLLSRQLTNAVHALGLTAEFKEVIESIGLSVDQIAELETEPALGNGGLGRLAACYLDAMSNTGVPAVGYGIYYEYGMFRQEFANGWQVELPEEWLLGPNPWDFTRNHPLYEIGFGGSVEHRDERAHWQPAEKVVAVAHDLLVPSEGDGIVNTLRLWAVRPVHGFDMEKFNRGQHVEASAQRSRHKSLSRLLYPDDSTEEGRELRLRQELFFCSASVQDVVRRFVKLKKEWETFPAHFAIHLNDTHPALAPVEFMRLLVDDHGVAWDRAWDITQKVFSYTNHTLMPEALEVWRADLVRRVAPRHLEIIEEINRRLMRALDGNLTGVSPERVAIVSSDQQPAVNMGRLCTHVSHAVNGVSKLHSDLVHERLFPDYALLKPGCFRNVTNGVSQRLWLYQANPRLTAMLDRHLDNGWRRDFDLSGLAAHAGDQAVLDELQRIKLANKHDAVKAIAKRTGIAVDPASLFDVQIKRIHEYKRQLLNILGVIARFNAIKANPTADWTPRTVLMAGKAASGYWLAKLIVRLAHDVATALNEDPQTSDLLRFVFLPNYNVSLAEFLIPAADLSQQISLAGTEASGTGNMKLALNGALTIGTADGANIEIADAAGQDNIFIFGCRVEDVSRKRQEGYSPFEVRARDERLHEVLGMIEGGYFSPGDPLRYQPVIDTLMGHGDRYLVLADFADYLRAQADVDAVWQDRTRWNGMTLTNISAMSTFSADRAVREYADSIWRLTGAA